MQCKPNRSKNKLQTARKRIERCYTERLLYNELYVNEQLSFSGKTKWESSYLLNPTVPPKQEEGHMNWLNETKNDFQSCFPDHDIKVTLENYDGMFPTKITISQYFKDSLISTETYIKQVSSSLVKWYLPVVDCYRKTKKVNQVKFQRFEKKSIWNTVDTIHVPPTTPNKYPKSEYLSISQSTST